MSIINCPECGNEISTQATTCPNCGFVLTREKPVVVGRILPTDQSEGIPKWVIIPAISLVAIIGILGFVFLRNQDDTAGKNINVSLANSNKPSRSIDSQPVRTAESVPPASVPSSQAATNPPSKTTERELPKTQQNVPSTSAEDVRKPNQDIGTVKIEAKVIGKSGDSQPVRNERFYLLDEDVETILAKAELEPIESNSLTNSLGLSMIYPERYGQFNRTAMEIIRKHSKYNVSTDTGGKATIADIKPNTYYLFGIVKSKTGFAIWNSSVSVNAGENILTLAPAKFNEINEE
jgi:hypothetical protein